MTMLDDLGTAGRDAAAVEIARALVRGERVAGELLEDFAQLDAEAGRGLTWTWNDAPTHPGGASFFRHI